MGQRPLTQRCSSSPEMLGMLMSVISMWMGIFSISAWAAAAE